MRAHRGDALRTRMMFFCACLCLSTSLQLDSFALDAQTQAEKKPADLAMDAYSLLLDRKPTPAELQFWNARLSKMSPFAIIDLYEGLTRLPEYRKRFAGLPPKAQIALMYRTLLRREVDPDSEKKWMEYLKKNGLNDTIETIVTSADRTMGVYQTAGLSTQQEWDAVHQAENTAATDRAKAQAMYRTIVRKTKVPEPWFYLARVERGINTRFAIETLQEELVKFPEDTLAELTLAKLFHDMGVMGRSFGRATHALRASDERAGADGLISSMKVRLDQAKHPEFLSREVLLARAEAHCYADQYDSALAELDKAMQFGPGSGQVYLLRSDTFYNMGRYEQAVKEGDIAYKYMGPVLSILWPRGLSLVELGQYQRGLEDMNKLIKMSPIPKFYFYRARCYENLGRRKEQIADLNTLIKVESKSPKHYIARGRAYLALGKNKEALADANKAVNLGKRHRESYKFRLEVYTKMHNKAGAEADRKTLDQFTKSFKKFDF